jgi:hypothetical protein
MPQIGRDRISPNGLDETTLAKLRRSSSNDAIPNYLQVSRKPDSIH